ncbi:hypothetical protein HG531_005003 [Fusarium graminearum]|nr:hypothetical protein HG531_005003 [Fusarium graminearum]
MLPPSEQTVGELASEIVAVDADADVALDKEVVEFDQAVMAWRRASRLMGGGLNSRKRPQSTLSGKGSIGGLSLAIRGAI